MFYNCYNNSEMALLFKYLHLTYPECQSVLPMQTQCICYPFSVCTSKEDQLFCHQSYVKLHIEMCSTSPLIRMTVYYVKLMPELPILLRSNTPVGQSALSRVDSTFPEEQTKEVNVRTLTRVEQTTPQKSTPLFLRRRFIIHITPLQPYNHVASHESRDYVHTRSQMKLSALPN